MHGYWRNSAHQDRQRTAHQDGGNANERKGQYPGHHTNMILQRRERLSCMREAERCANGQYRHTNFQACIDSQRTLLAVGKASEQPSTQREARKKRADASGDCQYLGADYECELLDPQNLIDQRRRPRSNQKERPPPSMQTRGLSHDRLRAFMRPGLTLRPFASFAMRRFSTSSERLGHGGAWGFQK